MNKEKIIRVKANQSKKTFTIRKYLNRKCYAKFRTVQLSDPEFQELENNTDNDWQDFLNTSNEYYPV